MRTTVTLDPDTEQLVRRRMEERGVSFKQALNDALREALGSRAGRAPFRTPVYDLGSPAVNLDRALQLAAEIEDEELVPQQQRVGN